MESGHYSKSIPVESYVKMVQTPQFFQPYKLPNSLSIRANLFEVDSVRHLTRSIYISLKEAVRDLIFRLNFERNLSFFSSFLGLMPIVN